MSACCNSAEGENSRSWTPRVREIVAWLVPSALLLFVPKCPVCLAAYVAIWSGFGMSLATATYLRFTMLLLCLASLLFLTVKCAMRLRRRPNTSHYRLKSFVIATGIRHTKPGSDERK